jgi:hypothetical protein
MLKKLRTLLGCVVRDIGRKIDGDSGLEGAFAKLLSFAKLLLLALRVHEQKQHQRAGRRSIPCMGRKSNASARARPIGLTSSASR